jgi:hypothetical protein
MFAEIVRDEERITARIGAAAIRWCVLYRIAGAAAIAIVASLPLAVVAFAVWPPPTSVPDWFAFIQVNRIAAVINLDLVLLLDQLLFLPIILALYVTLRRTNESMVMLGAIVTVVGAVLLIGSREATFSLLQLSDQYATATTEAQRTMLLAAGQTLLVTFNGTAFSIGYVLSGMGGLLLSAAMLGSAQFTKPTAYCGIAM